MNAVVLVALLVVVALGVTALVQWLRRPTSGTAFPTPLVGSHVVSVVVGVGLWIAFMATDTLALAWFAFAVIIIGNALGDIITTGRWRTVMGRRGAFFSDLGHAVASVLRGKAPASSIAHALAA